MTWNEGSITETSSLKGMIAELAASVGPQVACNMLVEF